MNTPSKEDHLHVSSGEHLSNPSHLSEVTKDLLDLLLSGDGVHVLIFISSCHVEAITPRSIQVAYNDCPRILLRSFVVSIILKIRLSPRA